MLDFNPLDIRRDKARCDRIAEGIATPDDSRPLLEVEGPDLVFEPTVIPAGRLFRDDVVTMMPFRRSMFTWPEGCSGETHQLCVDDLPVIVPFVRLT